MNFKVVTRLASATAIVALVIGGGFKLATNKANEAAEHSVSQLVSLAETASDGDLRLTYGDVNNDLFSGVTTVNDVTFKTADGAPVFEVGAVRFSADGGANGERLPHAVNLGLHGVVVVDPDALKNLNRNLSVDFRDSPFNVLVSYDYNGAGDVINPTLSVSGDGFADIDIAVTLSNVRSLWKALESSYAANGMHLDFDQNEQQTLVKLVKNVRINEATVTYTNNGEFEATIEREAAADGVTAEQMRLGISEAVDSRVGRTTYVSEVQAFLMHPKNITVTVKPELPIDQKELNNRAGLLMHYTQKALEGLDVTVKVNQQS